MTSMAGFMHAFFDYAKATWIVAVLLFMPLSVVVGIIQHVRKMEFLEAPWPFMMALMVLWIVGALAGLVVASLYCFLFLLGKRPPD
jgi:hypothetical protein